MKVLPNSSISIRAEGGGGGEKWEFFRVLLTFSDPPHRLPFSFFPLFFPLSLPLLSFPFSFLPHATFGEQGDITQVRRDKGGGNRERVEGEGEGGLEGQGVSFSGLGSFHRS